MARGPGPRGQCWLGGQACGPLSLARGQLGTEWAARWHRGDVLGRLPAPARPGGSVLLSPEVAVAGKCPQPS